MTQCLTTKETEMQPSRCERILIAEGDSLPGTSISDFNKEYPMNKGAICPTIIVSFN